MAEQKREDMVPPKDKEPQTPDSTWLDWVWPDGDGHPDVRASHLKQRYGDRR